MKLATSYFLKHLFCLDEQRVSIIIISYVVFVISAVYQIFTKGYLTEQLVDIIIWLSAFIVGYNGLQLSRSTNVNKESAKNE